MMSSITINIASDFTPYPAGRFRSDGEYSGERFREEVLRPAFENVDYDTITVDLDGAAGFGSSFLDEAFGGLVRSCGFAVSDVLRRLVVKSNRPNYLARIKNSIEQAAAPSSRRKA